MKNNVLHLTALLCISFFSCRAMDDFVVDMPEDSSVEVAGLEEIVVDGEGGRIMPIDDFVNCIMPKKDDDDDERIEMKAWVKEMEIGEYNAFASIVTRGDDMSALVLVLKKMNKNATESGKVATEALKEQRKANKLQKAAFEQQKQSAAFYQKTTVGAGALSVLTFILGGGLASLF